MTTQQNQPTQFKTVEREPLRWLFEAHFDNGLVIVQDQDDKSELRTDGTGSTYSDVVETEKEHKLLAFFLKHVDGNQIAMVDLVNGAFSVNGTPMHIHDQNFTPEKHDLRLVYFRETKIDNDVKGTVQDDGSIKSEYGLNAKHYVNRYFIGWQTTANNKNYQHTIAVG